MIFPITRNFIILTGNVRLIGFEARQNQNLYRLLSGSRKESGSLLQANERTR